MSTRALVTRHAPAAPPQPNSAVLPPGVSRGVNALGEVFYRDEFFPLDYRHGKVRLEAALSLHPDLTDRLGEGLDQGHLRAAAYLDIETAGLSGGTGTYAFLVGVGTFEGFAFRVRQFFLATPSGEAAMLMALNETIERCQAIVTFNGRTFDMPQLATRYALSRLPCAGEGLPHIDLLHPARRLFGKVLDSCRLGEIERRLLGLRRFHDISGAVIPALYLAYIRRAQVRGLDPIFEHNSLDVISLAAFVAYLNGVAGAIEDLPPDMHLGLGRWDELRDAWAQPKSSTRWPGAPTRPATTVVRPRGVWRASSAVTVTGDAAWPCGRKNGRIPRLKRAASGP